MTSAEKRGIRAGNYRIDKHGDLQLTRKRRVEIRRIVLGLFREERVKIAERRDTFHLHSTGRGKTCIETLVSVRKMPHHDVMDRESLKEESLFDASTIFLSFLSKLPDGTQWELARLLRKKFENNKKLKSRVLLWLKSARRQLKN